MTGHHGWGYGQNDGRHRPQPAPIHWDSSLTLPPSGTWKPPILQARWGPFSHPAPRARPTRWVRALAHLAQSARCSPSGPAASEPSASCLLLRAAPDDPARWDPGRTLTHSCPPECAAGGGSPGQLGAVRTQRAARCLCGERARLVCGDLPGAGLRVGKGAVSLAEFARRSVQAFELAGM